MIKFDGITHHDEVVGDVETERSLHLPGDCRLEIPSSNGLGCLNRGGINCHGTPHTCKRTIQGPLPVPRPKFALLRVLM
jgi:hypothetical protein